MSRLRIVFSRKGRCKRFTVVRSRKGARMRHRGPVSDNVWLSCFGRDVRTRSATRIDPATNTVAAVPSLPQSHGGSVAIIEGEPWFVGLFEDAGGNALGELLRIDPATGAVDLFVSIGPADPDSLVVAAGAIWSLMRLAISSSG